MAIQPDLGEMGSHEGPPSVVEWRWHYNLPSLPLWGFLILLLLVPRRNRDRRAWLILVLPLLVAGIGQLMSLASGSSGSLEILLYFLTTLSIAWAVVWLLAPWLCVKRRLVRALLIWGVMALVGTAGYLGYYEFTLSGDITGTWAVFWCIETVSLVAGMTISGFLCRDKKPMYVFMLWLALWILVACFLSMILFSVLMAICMGDVDMLGIILCSSIFVTIFFSLCVYILNVPVMILARYNSLYRERFAGLFCPIRLPNDYESMPAQSDVPLSAELASSDDENEGGNPFAGRDLFVE